MEAAVMAERSTTSLDLYIESDGSSPTSPIVQPTPLAIPPTTQHRQASIVMLAPLILLTVAVIAIRIGIGALIPLIAAMTSNIQDAIFDRQNNDHLSPIGHYHQRGGYLCD